MPKENKKKEPVMIELADMSPKSEEAKPADPAAKLVDPYVKEIYGDEKELSLDEELEKLSAEVAREQQAEAQPVPAAQQPLEQVVTQSYRDAGPMIDQLQGAQKPKAEPVPAAQQPLEQVVTQSYRNAGPVIDQLQGAKKPETDWEALGQAFEDFEAPKVRVDPRKTAERNAIFAARKEEFYAHSHATALDEVAVNSLGNLNMIVGDPHPWTKTSGETAFYCVVAMVLGEAVRAEREKNPGQIGPLESQFVGKTKQQIWGELQRNPDIQRFVTRTMPNYSKKELVDFIVENKAAALGKAYVQQLPQRTDAPKAPAAVNAQPAPKKQAAPAPKAPAKPMPLKGKLKPVAQQLKKAAMPQAKQNATAKMLKHVSKIKKNAADVMSEIEKADRGVFFGHEPFDNARKAMKNYIKTWTFAAEAKNPERWHTELHLLANLADIYLASKKDLMKKGPLSGTTRDRVNAMLSLKKFAVERMKELEPHVRARRHQAQRKLSPVMAGNQQKEMKNPTIH